jgi:hypothetical protein
MSQARKNLYVPPPAPPEPPPARLSLSEIKEIGEFFKGLLEETTLTKWIVLAGVGGICELLRIIWDASRFLLHR